MTELVSKFESVRDFMVILCVRERTRTLCFVCTSALHDVGVHLRAPPPYKMRKYTSSLRDPARACTFARPSEETRRQTEARRQSAHTNHICLSV